MKDKLLKEVNNIVNKQIADNIDVAGLIPMFSWVGKVQFAKFQELKKAGFSPAESIELCKGPLFIDISIPPSRNSEDGS